MKLYRLQDLEWHEPQCFRPRSEKILAVLAGDGERDISEQAFDVALVS